MVALQQRLVAVDNDVQVLFHAPGRDGERVVVVPADGDPGTDAVAEQGTGEGSPMDGTLSFPTEGWEPGSYEAILVDGTGAELTRTPFWAEADAKTTIATTKLVYEVGEPIRVEWRSAPGNRWDWIGIYKRGADRNVASYKQWSYTGATIEGSVVLDKDSSGSWPLRPGKYSVYLLQDDSYVKVAGGNFSVTSAG